MGAVWPPLFFPNHISAVPGVSTNLNTVQLAVIKLIVACVLTISSCCMQARGMGTPISPDNTYLALELSIVSGYGDTGYQLEALTESVAFLGVLEEIRSELVFPLDVPLLGLSATWNPEAGNDRWELDLDLLFSMSDPGRPMTDRDWVGGTQIALSESRSQASIRRGSSTLRWRLRQGRRTSQSLLLGLHGQDADFHLMGFEGWRRSRYSETRHAVSGTAAAIDYRVTSLTSQAGAEAAWTLGTRMQLRIAGTAGPAFAWDRDDHLLRGRLSKGGGVGVGAHVLTALDLLSGHAPRDRLTVSLVGELHHLHTWGDVTQTWYRDEDMPAGTVIRDIPYEIESLQATVGLRVGVAF